MTDRHVNNAGGIQSPSPIGSGQKLSGPLDKLVKLNPTYDRLLQLLTIRF
ncbi:hypothetical protein ABIE18_003823 [Arthrobacter sp. 2762]